MSNRRPNRLDYYLATLFAASQVGLTAVQGTEEALRRLFVRAALGSKLLPEVENLQQFRSILASLRRGGFLRWSQGDWYTLHGVGQDDPGEYAYLKIALEDGDDQAQQVLAIGRRLAELTVVAAT